MTSVHHTFDIHIAQKLKSTDLAILVHHFDYWISYNQRQKKNFYDGKYWMYQSLSDIANHFPYWSVDQVKRFINKLVKMKVLIKGNFNKVKFDRTVWYSFSDEFANSIWRNRQMDAATSSNGNCEIARPIPDTKTNTKTSINTCSYDRKNSDRSTKSGITFSNEKNEFENISEQDRQLWMKAYPDVDIGQELYKMLVWLKSNPSKAHKKNWAKFITTWMAKEQDKISSRMARQAHSNYQAENDEDSWQRQNTKTFYEWKKLSNGALDHCYVKNGYVINKENGREASVKLKPDAFEALLCDVAGVRRSRV